VINITYNLGVFARYHVFDSPPNILFNAFVMVFCPLVSEYFKI
jgi:O-antigen/teichoic acid export membrane protein